MIILPSVPLSLLRGSLMTGQNASLLSADVVAEMLGLSQNAVYSLCDAGLIAHYRIGFGEKSGSASRRNRWEAYLKAPSPRRPRLSRYPPKETPAKVEGYRRRAKLGIGEVGQRVIFTRGGDETISHKRQLIGEGEVVCGVRGVE